MRCRLIVFAAMAALGCGAKSGLPDLGHGGATASSSSSASSSAVSSSQASSTSAGGCNCGCGLTCVNGQCINFDNDPQHCGTFEHACPTDAPLCLVGTCQPITCDPGGPKCDPPGSCCGTFCCNEGEICCAKHGGCCDQLVCQKPNAQGSCDPGNPCTECASPDTPIATPTGERAIASLREGELVYSVDGAAIVVVPIALVKRTPVHGHHVVDLRFENGAELHVSPRHPTADGRMLGDLRAGDVVFGVRVVSAKLIDYKEPATFDILPASPTGAYFADGVLIGTTLR